MTRISRRLLTLAIAGVLFLVGCSSEPPAQGSRSPGVSVSPHPGPEVLAESEESEALSAGTYVLDLAASASGVERIPNITITVPDGWAHLGNWVVHSGEGTDHFVGITFWDVDEVYAHPCQWSSRTIQPGPTVVDLAKALAERPLRDATEPVDIVVDGYRGMQLEWSVPVDIDFSTCDQDDFRSWTGVEGSWGGSVRYHQGPGQVNRLWILDIEGERLVVDTMYMPSTDAGDRKELLHVMESIRFET